MPALIPTSDQYSLAAARHLHRAIEYRDKARRRLAPIDRRIDRTMMRGHALYWRAFRHAARAAAAQPLSPAVARLAKPAREVTCPPPAPRLGN